MESAINRKAFEVRDAEFAEFLDLLLLKGGQSLEDRDIVVVTAKAQGTEIKNMIVLFHGVVPHSAAKNQLVRKLT